MVHRQALETSETGHTDSGNRRDDLAELELVQDGGLTSGIKTNHQDAYPRPSSSSIVQNQTNSSVSEATFQLLASTTARDTHASPSCRRGRRGASTLRDPWWLLFLSVVRGMGKRCFGWLSSKIGRRCTGTTRPHTITSRSLWLATRRTTRRNRP